MSGFVGPGPARGRHQVPPQFEDDLLPAFSVGADVPHIERVERNRRGAGGLLSLVVAADAVLIQQGALRGDHRLHGICRLLPSRGLHMPRADTQR